MKIFLLITKSIDISPDERNRAKEYGKHVREVSRLVPSNSNPLQERLEDVDRLPSRREDANERVQQPERKISSPSRNLKNENTPLPTHGLARKLRNMSIQEDDIPEKSPNAHQQEQRDYDKKLSSSNHEQSDSVPDKKTPTIYQQQQQPQSQPQYQAQQNQYGYSQPQHQQQYLNLPEVYHLDRNPQQYGYQGRGFENPHDQQNYQIDVNAQPRNKWRENQQFPQHQYVNPQYHEDETNRRHFPNSNQCPPQSHGAMPTAPQIRPVNRNNIFTAVLSLIQELDPERLQMVKAEIDKVLQQQQQQQ